MDLSAYIDFAVTLDYVRGKLVVTDTGNYPLGVKENIIGILDVTQPDRIKIEGDFNSPDIIYDSGDLTPSEKDLRLSSNNQPAKGTFTIKYVIDHPDYTPTTLTKTFELTYSRKTLDLRRSFDVFTPSLFYRDLTNFSQGGFDITSNAVAWSTTITAGTITGATSDFDINYNGNYYDSLYDISYQRDLTYLHQTYTYLTLIDRYTETISTQADTPPNVAGLIQCLDGLKERLDDAGCNCAESTTLEAKYQKATVRYSHLIHKLLVGDTSDAGVLINEFVCLTSCTHSINRGEIIPPYDLSMYTGGSSSSGYLFYPYTIPSDCEDFTLTPMNGKTIRAMALDGIERQFSNGDDEDPITEGHFLVVSGSVPRKFKYGGTLREGQWIKITYSD